MQLSSVIIAMIQLHYSISTRCTQPVLILPSAFSGSRKIAEQIATTVLNLKMCDVLKLHILIKLNIP